MNSLYQKETSGGIPRPVRARKLRAAFNAVGLRMTRQRLITYRELAGRFDHPDVECIYQAVKPRVPKISLFTVYRTLNVFESVGLARRVATWKGHARYDANVEAHAHFLCETCGRICNVETGDTSALCNLVAGEAGKIRHVSVMFYGEGPACAALHAKQAMA